MSRYGAETIGCHEWNEQASRSVKLANTPRQALVVQVQRGRRARDQEGSGSEQTAQSQWMAASAAGSRARRDVGRAHACEGGGAGQGRSRRTHLDAPNPAAARMRGISCNPDLGLLQGIASLCRRAPHSMSASPQAISRRRQSWVLATADVLESLGPAQVPRPLMSLPESPSTAPCTPTLTDLSIALSLAPGSAGPPSLVAGFHAANRSAFKKRQRRNLGAGPNTHGSSRQRPGRAARGCAGVPVSSIDLGRAPAACLSVALPPVCSLSC